MSLGNDHCISKLETLLGNTNQDFRHPKSLNKTFKITHNYNLHRQVSNRVRISVIQYSTSLNIPINSHSNFEDGHIPAYIIANSLVSLRKGIEKRAKHDLVWF